MPTRTYVALTVEIAALAASVVLAGLWMNSPSGPYEPFFAATALLLLATEGFRRYEGRVFLTEGVERTPSERVKHHDSLRDRFKEEINRCRTQHLRRDVIIRHVNRMDDYPNTEAKRGMSPWFKAGLLDTYHMGIVVGLGWEGLIDESRGWRKANYKSGGNGKATFMLAGEIPYDFIESLNVDGDEYYYLPHIFCHFANRGEPYKRLYYAERVDMGHGHEYWREVVSQKEVLRNTEKHDRRNST